jgi:hypothetical protein
MLFSSKSRSGGGKYPSTTLGVGLTIRDVFDGGGEGATPGGNLLVILESMVKMRSAASPGLSSGGILRR